jgi:hypothetical protein
MREYPIKEEKVMKEYNKILTIKNEISGFGGEYEQGCRKMVIAGLEFLDKNKDKNPSFSEYKNIYGVIKENNKDAKLLSSAIVKACPDCSGAMHQATVSHILYIKKNGLEKYLKEMNKDRDKEA